jgi:hypothetical protein
MVSGSTKNIAMKKILFITVLLLCLGSVYSQTNPQRVEAELAGGITFLNFRNNELVAPKRRHGNGVGDEVMGNVYFVFPIMQHRWSLRTGLGYAERNIYMNKTSISDFFVSIFSAPPDRDSFKLTRMQLLTRYLNIPAGISGGITKNKKQRVQIYAGGQFIASILVDKNAILDFDEYYLVPTPAERQQVEQTYENTASGFILSFQPRMDMHIRIWKGAGIRYGLIPIVFYFNSWNNKLATNRFAFTSSFGVYYNF